MNRLRAWFHRRLRNLASWALVKLAVAGIEEADGEALGKRVKDAVAGKIGPTGMPLLPAVRGYLEEVRRGLA